MPVENENRRICRRCGRHYELTDEQREMRERAGFTEDLCECCFDARYVVCSDCGRLIRRGYDDYYTVETDYRGFRENGSDAEANNQRVICPSCRHNGEYDQCVDCYAIFPSDWGLLEDNDYCHHCEERRLDREDESRPQVHAWNYKTSPIFHNLKSDPYVLGTGTREYFGIELEYNDIDRKRQLCEKLMEFDGNKLFYAKSDGSLRNGIEIVSHPCTVDYHKQIDYDKLFNAVRDHGTSNEVAKDNCGLHIHVNKASLGTSDSEKELNIAKLCLLFDNLWESYFRIFSRRPNASNLIQYADKKYLALHGELMKNKSQVSEFELGMAFQELGKADRYTAVNLSNRNTVEFRFPLTTLDRDEVVANVEMLHHVIKYAKTHSVRKVKGTTDWKVIYSGKSVGMELKNYHKKYLV